MSEATHTPGPWHLHPSGKPNCLDTYTVFHGHGERLDNQICAADLRNARLIAAAPDLLAVCLLYRDARETDDADTLAERRAALLAAIARATG